MIAAPGRRLLSAAAVAVLAAATAGCAGGGTASTHDDNPGLVLINTSKYKGNIITPVVKPTTVLMDTAGKPFDIRAMTPGGVTLLFFGYTHCPDECPLTMASTAAALRMLPAAQRAKIRVLFVTVDPARVSRAGSTVTNSTLIFARWAAGSIRSAAAVLAMVSGHSSGQCE